MTIENLKTKDMKGVHELNNSELEELRSRWYHQHMDDGSILEVCGYYPKNEQDVPMDIVMVYYEGTLFTDEDFFCNLPIN